MNNNKAYRGGISFTGALAILFIALKLIGVINWSWVWVLAPLWIPLAIFVILILLACIFKSIHNML